MGNTGEDVDVDVDATSSMKMEKKKSKNRISDGDDNTHVETDGGHLKEKVHKHTKKKKSESNEDVLENGDIQKKRKREKENDDDPKLKKNKKSIEDEDEGDNGNLEDNGDLHKKKKKKKKDSSEKTLTKENEGSQDDDPKLEKHKKKKKKSKSNEDGEDNGNLEDNGESQKKDKKKKKKDSSENSQKKKTKKVTFSSDVEIFPPSKPKPKRREKTKSDNLVRGKRFTREEDEIVKQAVQNYIISNNLGDDGLKMILNCKSHKALSKCWQDIGTCIPYRPYTAIYYRAHILFEQSEHRQWTPEQINFLKESQKKHGNNWKMIAEELGKHRFHVKDTWRRIKLDNLKNGKWSQDEYQGLYDMVNLDLQMKITGQEKKSKHGMLRDNIPWTSISEKLSTRSDATCCRKWYEQLTSSLVAEKKWADADDYWLVGRLYEIDAACVDDVDWDGILEHRSGEICRKRWDQMVVRIGDHRSKTFGEMVEILAKWYRPELAEARQTWDDQPVVP